MVRGIRGDEGVGVLSKYYYRTAMREARVIVPRHSRIYIDRDILLLTAVCWSWSLFSPQPGHDLPLLSLKATPGLSKSMVLDSVDDTGITSHTTE